MHAILDKLGTWLARYLSRPLARQTHVATSTPEALAGALRKGDVLLVEGNTRFSLAIKYLTQSSWSHSSIYIGDALGPPPPGEEPKVLIDADILDGVRAIPLSEFSGLHTRICRPVGLSAAEIDALIAHLIARLGHQYDLKNVFDLLRYLVPTPPIPARYRRRVLAIGSGDPTKAICSAMIAKAFQSVNYPILPAIVMQRTDDETVAKQRKEFLIIKHYSLFAPRDFDVSPYFQIVKPTIEHGFDPRTVKWSRPGAPTEPPPDAAETTDIPEAAEVAAIAGTRGESVPDDEDLTTTP